MRYSPRSWRKGKSGALRVLYAFLPDHSVSVLAAAYPKNEKEDITPREKKALKVILQQISDALEKERSSGQRGLKR